jgi:hypothetical protein
MEEKTEENVITEMIQKTTASKRKQHKGLLAHLLLSLDGKTKLRRVVKKHKGGRPMIRQLLKHKEQSHFVSTSASLTCRIPQAVAYFEETPYFTHEQSSVSARTVPQLCQERTLETTSQQPLLSFALEFNECTITTIAEWVKAPWLNRRPAKRRGIVLRPTVNVKFRKCRVCLQFGHFEISCPNAKKDHFVRQARDLKVGGKEDQQVPKIATNRNPSSVDNLVVEECNGFVIEASKRTFEEIDWGEQEIEETFLDNLVIEAAPLASVFLTSEEEVQQQPQRAATATNAKRQTCKIVKKKKIGSGKSQPGAFPAH